MDAVRAHLVRRDAQIVLLLTPPFDRMTHDPGYIKGYLPGIRENGGQYTHAAIWTVIALARLGLGDEAMELFHMINPINHMRTAGGHSSATGSSRTSSPPTSTRTRCTSAAAAGPGTPARRDGCIRPPCSRCSGSAGTGRRSASIPASRRSGRSTRWSGGSAARVIASPSRIRSTARRASSRRPGRHAEVNAHAIPWSDDGGSHEVTIVLGNSMPSTPKRRPSRPKR